VSSNGSNGHIFGGERLRQLAPMVAGGALAVAAVAVAVAWVGCGNHHTPPGHIGYVKSRPIFGAGKFIGTQEGPTSTGFVWRQEIVNLDIRPRTFSEQMVVPTRNRLQLSLRAHARIRIRPATKQAQEVVERYGGENWYANNVRDQYRATVRDKVQRLDAFEVKDEMRRIGDEVLADMQARYADTPIEFLSVDVGDIVYPQGVVDSVIAKFVTNEENERRDIELEIAQKQIEIGIAEAQGIADAQQIIRTTLDPMFLQFEALRAIEDMAGSPNTTFLMFPFSKSGNAPVVMIPETK
jgi:uncharacterized protein (DUF2164 family)